MQKYKLIKSPQILVLFELLLCSFFLTSCWVTGSLEMELNVYKGNKYQMDILLQIPSESIFLIGGVDEFELALKEMLSQELNNEELWKWEKSQSANSSTHYYRIKSKNTEIINGEFFEWTEMKYKNRKAYLIEFTYAYELSKLMSDYKLTLHADKILESNGMQIDSKTVTWINPRTVPYAVVIPKGFGQLILIIIVGFVIVIFISIFLYLLFSGKLKKWIEILGSSKNFPT